MMPIYLFRPDLPSRQLGIDQIRLSEVAHFTPSSLPPPTLLQGRRPSLLLPPSARSPPA